MKISIEYRAPDAESKRALRLTYYAGCYRIIRYDVLKRTFLFSCCTGLRWSDIHKLTRAELKPFYGHYRIV